MSGFGLIRFRSSLTTLAGACALALGTASAAQASLAASASISLDNLSYRVIDLDPNDGVTASFSLAPRTAYLETQNWSSIEESALHSWTADSLLPATPATITDTVGGSISIGPGGLSVASSIDVTSPDPEVLAASNFYYVDNDERAARAALEPTFNDDGSINFYTLSAKSMVVIEGRVSAHLMTNGGALVAAAEGLYGMENQGLARTRASVSLTGALLGGYMLFDPTAEGDPTDPFYFSESYNSTRNEFYLYKSVGEDHALYEPGQYEGQSLLTDLNWTVPFKLVLLNDQTYTTAAMFDLEARVSTQSALSLTPPPTTIPNLPPTGPIPEPGTFALMGLGLAGVAAARRRQR